jgi:cell division septation protein DedD
MAKSAPAQVAATTPPPPPTPELAASPAAPPPPVVLAQTPSAAPAPGRPAEQGQPLGFVIQAGLYVGPIQSNRLAESLTQAGFSAYVLERPRPDNKTRYYVLVGPFAQREMAQQAIAEIKAKLGLTTFLTDPEEPGKLVR